MAKVKIQGHASGTGVLTVTAPNTSTDRTITLPDATGTLLTADGDGSSLTGISSFNPDAAVTINDSGADVDFRVESSNDANAFFVDGANGKIGLGIAGALGATLHIDPDTNVTTSYGSPLVKVGGSNGWAGNGSIYSIGFGYTNGATVKAPVEVGMVTTSATGVTEGSFVVATRDGTTDAAPAKKLEITSDGRGISSFTVRAWCQFSGVGTPSFWGSAQHNVSSITDVATGNYNVNFTNAMANTNYCAIGTGQGGLNVSPDGWATTYVKLNLRVEATNSSADGGHVGVAVFTEA
jgi:hypothetical protein